VPFIGWSGDVKIDSPEDDSGQSPFSRFFGRIMFEKAFPACIFGL
jgi:hypothetical protein